MSSEQDLQSEFTVDQERLIKIDSVHQLVIGGIERVKHVMCTHRVGTMSMDQYKQLVSELKSSVLVNFETLERVVGE